MARHVLEIVGLHLAWAVQSALSALSQPKTWNKFSFGLRVCTDPFPIVRTKRTDATHARREGNTQKSQIWSGSVRVLSNFHWSR